MKSESRIYKFHFRLLLLVIGSILFFQCNNPTEEEAYRDYEKEELSKDKRYDSLFKGIYFKMSKMEFRKYCFEMNLKGEFKQGGNKNPNWVVAKINEMNYPAAINFYPSFRNDTINEMHAALYYDNAVYKDGTFNKDSLFNDVISLLDKWYGGKTFKIKSPYVYKEDIYAKIQGNKRITIYQDINQNLINLWFVDLSNIEK